MKKLNVFVLILSLNCIYLSQSFSQENLSNWTQFRGSKLNGVATGEKYPVQWNDSTNIEWKTELDGKGWSSPVVFGDQVWCTNASENGKELYAICFNFNSGNIIRKIKVFTPEKIYRIHAVNSYATPTPSIEKDRVYVHYGRYGTACIDSNTGEIIWKRDDLQCEHAQGPGSSLLLHRDKLILHLEGTDTQFIVALDKTTGETIWKTYRPEKLYEPLLPIGKKAYITPIVITVDGKELLISNGAAVCIAYDIETGKEVWRIIQGEDSTIAMPQESNGNIYFYTSFVTPEDGPKYCELLAVDPSGQGDIGNTNILWRIKSPPLQLPTPVIKDGYIYTIDSKSYLMCIEEATGEVVYSDRLNGKFNSSPIAAAGNIYASTTRGETIVFSEGPVKEVVAENLLDGEIWSTPVFVRGSILMRTSNYLYKIKDHEY